MHAFIFFNLFFFYSSNNSENFPEFWIIFLVIFYNTQFYISHCYLFLESSH